ncbi:MAG: glycosyltransferase [Bacteroidia bacterium]|nr:glycosyltransferase [Bacteroidia bacterium]
MALENKKIVIVGPGYPLRGGLSTFNERLCKELNLKNNCSILSFSLQYPDFLFPGTTQFSTDPNPVDIEIDTAINSVNPLNWLKVGNKYKKLKPDLIIFRYWMPFMAPALGTIARRIKSNGHTRIVAITDNVLPHEKHFYDKPFTKYFLSAVDGFVTMSRAVLADLDLFVKDKPKLYTPHPMYDNFGAGIEKQEAKKALGLDPSFDYILFFGFIRKYKGLDLLLKSFADKRLRNLPVKLIIAGEYYEDSAPYKSLIDSLGLKDYVIEITDFIPNNEVSTYFSACDLVAQTYNSATQSGVTQVAYHFNKPMLVTNVGGLAELVPNEIVGYVTDRDPLKIADAIFDFYMNKKEETFVKNILQEKLRFTWPAMVEAIEKVSGL